MNVYLSASQRINPTSRLINDEREASDSLEIGTPLHSINLISKQKLFLAFYLDSTDYFKLMAFDSI